MSVPVSLRFTETMRGFVTLDESDPQRGYDQGRADGTALSFQLTISTDDVDAFVADPNHAAVATGHIDCDALGGRRPVAGGAFKLFVAATPQHNARGARRMLYRLPFTDAAGHALTLYGRKDIEDDPGFDLWRDTSTLYTRIYAGQDGQTAQDGRDEQDRHTVQAEPGPPTGRVVAAGIVTLHIPDFLQQLTTIRVSAPGADNPLPALRGLEAFGRLFLGELWEIYAPRVASGNGPHLTDVAPSPSPSLAPSPPPPRPVDRSERAVGFRPAKPCRWLAPSLLAPAAGRAWIGSFLGTFADRREVMASLPAQPAEDLSAPAETGTSDSASTGEFWVDYVADPGDGFDATYTIAWLLAAPVLDVGEPEPLPRGRMLVMGGDQCYPTASISGYQDRLVGPYRAALPFVPGGPDDQPRLYALPGNHDWYDGLTSFLRVFCQEANVGAWRTKQSRSYFAVRLPHRWWLLGIDVQFDSYLDQPQRRYFQQVASAMREGDAVIVCSGVPSWVAAGEGQPEAYAVLDFFERTVIRPSGAQVLVWVAGDRHHYARYAEVDGPGQKITSGGGGAYFVPTHRLPDSVVLPPKDSRAPNKTAPPARFVLRCRYPDAATSRRLGLGIARLPWLAPGLCALVGGLYLLIALAVGEAAQRPGGRLADRPDTIASNLRGAGLADLAAALVTSVAGIAVLVLTVVVCVLATRASRTRKGWVVGILHATCQLALAVVVLFGVLALVADLPGRWMLAVAAVLVWVAGGLAGTMLLAAYLLVAYDVARFASDDVYAAQGIAGYKNFLRMRIGPDGSLTIYPIGVPAVPRRWNLERGGSPEEPWFSPADRQPEPFLIEPPIRVEPPTAEIDFCATTR